MKNIELYQDTTEVSIIHDSRYGFTWLSDHSTQLALLQLSTDSADS